MNRSYQSGRRREYKIKKKMESLGYIVLRSSGSHGYADLICINKQWRVIRFIQVKPKNFSENEKIKIEKEYDWINSKDFETHFEVAS